MDEGTAKASILASHARGYMDGRSLAEVFAWLRPNDLIWNYWVNELPAREAPHQAFVILHWNADTTRMPAALHRNFIEIAMANALTKPGAVSMLGSPSTFPRSTSTATSWRASMTIYTWLADRSGGMKQAPRKLGNAAARLVRQANPAERSTPDSAPSRVSAPGVAHRIASRGHPVAGVIDHCAQGRVGRARRDRSRYRRFPRAPGRGGLIDVR